VLLIAHRMPSSAEACARFLAAGVDLFEVDVQLSPSGMVVSHYGVVPHTRGWLQRDNWRVRWGRAGGRDPMLAAHLRNVPDDTRILLDPKGKEPDRAALVDAIIETLTDRERFVVSTGNLTALKRLRQAGFETWRSLGDRAGLDKALAGGRLPESAVTVRHTLLDARTVKRLHEVADTVVAWTVNGVDRARALREAGVNGVTTDSLAVVNALGSA
jgi:glycerophosphoryl diester phosphodiesterase